MNKKGQVLIAFILLLPIIFMFLGLLIDCGYLLLEKRNVDNNTKDALKYGLKIVDEDEKIVESKIKKQLNSNIEDVKKLDIKIENKIIEINVEKTKKSIFTVIFSRYEYLITSHYRGYINENKIVIRKV